MAYGPCKDWILKPGYYFTKTHGNSSGRRLQWKPVAVAAVADDAAAAGPSEVTETLTDIGGTKVAVIKAVREITGLGLVDAKGLVDKAPSVIKENIKPEEAEEIKKKLMDAGASVEIK